MNNYLIYFIWSLLPLLLFFFAAVAVANKIFGEKGKDSGMNYFRQGAYCLIPLVVSILIDWFAVPPINEQLGIDESVLFFVVLMIYPVVLYLSFEIDSKMRGK